MGAEEGTKAGKKGWASLSAGQLHLGHGGGTREACRPARLRGAGAGHRLGLEAPLSLAVPRDPGPQLGLPLLATSCVSATPAAPGTWTLEPSQAQKSGLVSDFSDTMNQFIITSFQRFLGAWSGKWVLPFSLSPFKCMCWGDRVPLIPRPPEFRPITLPSGIIPCLGC